MFSYVKNIGYVERIVRFVVGVVLVSLVYVGPENPWFFLGLIPIGTAILGWCPPYQLLGINTCRRKDVSKV